MLELVRSVLCEKESDREVEEKITKACCFASSAALKSKAAFLGQHVEPKAFVFQKGKFERSTAEASLDGVNYWLGPTLDPAAALLTTLRV